MKTYNYEIRSIPVHIDVKLHKQFKKYCDKNKLKMKDVAGEAIENYLKEKEMESAK